ncbi:unnamed protein product [Amoebophrya sp. A25]|nr:unnamed protein product [Amoebophrya sp. A25]|eukprot:GSA25T00015878001.1
MDSFLSDPWRTRSALYGTHEDAFVSTSQPLATQAGLEMLRRGGNAADAAIATVLVLNVIEPCQCGIGGDAFALYWDEKTKCVSGMNASGRSPKGLNRDSFIASLGSGVSIPTAIPGDSIHAVTVPGAMAGYCDFLEKYGSGKFSRSEIFASAIALAEDGFPVPQWTAGQWEGEEKFLLAGENGHEMLVEVTDKKEGAKSKSYRAPREGEIKRNPGIASLLRRIAIEGKSAFYEGDTAEKVVEMLQRRGSFMTLDDLKCHETTWDTPICVSYRGLNVWEMPPNGQGLAALIALNILEQVFSPTGSGMDEQETHRAGKAKTSGGSIAVEDSQRLHLMIEACKLAFRETNYYVSDPAFAKIPMETLLSKEYAAKLAALIRPSDIVDGLDATAFPTKIGVELPQGEDITVVSGNNINNSSTNDNKERTKNNPFAPVNSSGTTQFVVMDHEGNACSFIESNYAKFGTNLVPKGCGFTLLNRGSNFLLEEGHPNCVEGGKRPYHTIIPGLATVGNKGKPLNKMHHVERTSGASSSSSTASSLEDPRASQESASGTEQQELVCVFGNMGGFMQPQGHLQLISNMVDYGMDFQEAIDFPRFCLQPGLGARGKPPEFVNDNSCGVGEEKPPPPIDAWIERDLYDVQAGPLASIGHPNLKRANGAARCLFGRAQIVGYPERARKRTTAAGNEETSSNTLVRSAGSESRCDGCAFFVKGNHYSTY